MKVHFAQFYIEPGADFPFSHHFQHRLSEEVTALVEPSPKFIKKYGSDFELMFRMSAKKDIKDTEIRGPTVFRKTKDVEYTVFLPFDVITSTSHISRSALRFLLQGACSVLKSLEIETAKVAEKQETLIEQICSDPTMFTWAI